MQTAHMKTADGRSFCVSAGQLLERLPKANTEITMGGPFKSVDRLTQNLLRVRPTVEA